MLDFLSLKALVAVIEEGSIAAGAQREHLAASAISRRIAKLESDTGAQLLYRVHRGVVPTPAGAALFRHAKEMLLNLQRIERDLGEYSHGIKGHVRIFANTSAIVQFLPEDLAIFLGLHPGIKIELEEKTSRSVIGGVESGITDIGICASNVPTGNLQVFPYREDRLMVVMQAGHPLAQRESIRFADTIGFDHVGLQEGSSLDELIMANARAINRAIRLRLQVTSFDGLRRMVQAGHGIGILPEGGVRQYLEPMNLVAVVLDEAWARRKFILAVRDLNLLPVAAQLMVNDLTQDSREPALAEE